MRLARLATTFETLILYRDVLWRAGSAAAQEAAASPGPVHDYLGAPSPTAPGVEVQAWFPSHPRLQFPLGETVSSVEQRCLSSMLV